MAEPTVVSVVGVRPQFVKHAPVSRALRRRCREVVVHTGQHYDFRMSRLFFEELGIPAPDHHLEVGSGSHATQTGLTAQRLEAVIEAIDPDLVLVFGDTNTTLGAAIAVCKLPILLGHVEAGVRTNVPRNPEELNRILVDHASDHLFVPTESGRRHLEREGVRGSVHLVGDVMIDALFHFLEVAAGRPHPAGKHALAAGEYVLTTIHRAENTDQPAALAGIIDGLAAIDDPIVFPLHPRTRESLACSGLDARLRALAHVHVTEPAGYLDMLLLERDARLILTDSGGVQKEAYVLGVPCVTVFPDSAWPETVADGWNRLVAPTGEVIADAVRTFRPEAPRHQHYGDGKAAQRIATIIAELTGA